MARDVIHQLLASDLALDKLGARDISAGEAEQLPRNRHVTVRNPREDSDPGKRVLLIGETDGGRRLTCKCGVDAKYSPCEVRSRMSKTCEPEQWGREMITHSLEINRRRRMPSPTSISSTATWSGRGAP